MNLLDLHVTLLQVKYGIINYVYPELQNLYKWLELEFHPLKLATRVQGSLEFIGTKDELKQYVSALQDITITRLLKQVCTIPLHNDFEWCTRNAPRRQIVHHEADSPGNCATQM